jgi:hypothetical protein
LVLSTPCVPKFSVVALFTVQVAVIVICTVMVAVDVAAWGELADARSKAAPTAATQPRDRTLGFMTLPLGNFWRSNNST